MAQSFIAALGAARSPEEVVERLDAEARARGAHSAAYFWRTASAGKDGWSTNDPDWRARYAAERLDRRDPELRRETRPTRAQWFRFDRLSAETGPDQAFYGRIAEAGFTAGLFVPDPTPEGMREMATVNMTLRARPDDLQGWIDGPGYELRMLSAAAISRIRDLRESEAPAPPLTAREAEVLTLIARGLRPAAIAASLGITPRTVEFHVLRARETLGVPTRDAAVAQAAARGWIDVG